jgi:hypothetical protein
MIGAPPLAHVAHLFAILHQITTGRDDLQIYLPGLCQLCAFRDLMHVITKPPRRAMPGNAERLSTPSRGSRPRDPPYRGARGPAAVAPSPPTRPAGRRGRMSGVKLTGGSGRQTTGQRSTVLATEPCDFGRAATDSKARTQSRPVKHFVSTRVAPVGPTVTVEPPPSARVSRIDPAAAVFVCPVGPHQSNPPLS